MRRGRPGMGRSSGPQKGPGRFLGQGRKPGGTMMPTDKRPADKGMDHGTPASEAFKFPMREKLPTKDAD